SDKADSIAARLVAPEIEGGDVYSSLPHKRSEFANEPRLVLVGDVEHVRAELRFETNALDLDDTRPTIGEYCSGHGTLTALCLHDEAHVGLIGALLATLHLLDHEPALTCHCWRRHHVHVGELRAQQAGKHGGRQCTRIHFRDLARVLDPDVLQPSFSELASEIGRAHV